MGIGDALDGIDGLLLTGGDDITPGRYGETPHPTVVEAEPGRDEFELALVKAARDRHLPIFGICRGIQVLNVAFGGTLVQDIPSAMETDLSHSLQQPRDHVAHQVTVTPDSMLHRALGPAVDASHTCRVNSRHHQSVGQLGAGLRAAATAPDGVIEAIEAPGAPFCVGVQWHPENFWRTGEFSSLFESFVRAARERLNAARERSGRRERRGLTTEVAEEAESLRR
jgi:putative glutamine amidotransferase